MITGAKFFTDAINSISPEIQKQVDMSMSVSDAITHILSKQGLSQKDFAKMMGKTEKEISYWLAGRHNFTLATLAKISTVLNENFIQITNYQANT